MAMTYQDRVDRITELLEQRLALRGKTLDAKLRNAGRLLPKSIHKHAQTLVEPIKLQGHPKLAKMIDDNAVAGAYKICEKYLLEVDRADLRRGKVIGFLSTNALNLLLIAAMVFGVLLWRGYI